MSDSAVAVVEEALTVVVEVVLFGVLTTAGLVSEQFALADLTSGEVLGVWYLFMGALALYAGLYAVGYERLLPHLTRRLPRH
jgi:Kef-type K+ transport system membrane component KefB